MAQFSLAWILNNRVITSVLCDANSTQQLDENIGAVEVSITKEELNLCDEVWQELRPPRFYYRAQQFHRL